MAAIQAIPESAARLLKSGQVLIDPASVVKELLDNALDANATTIKIGISANTINKIEVRDNGHGIALDDLQHLGKRGHTSKLRNFEELRDLGGRTLGFRGEALAAACNFGEVVVTTRCDGAQVASCVRLNVGGGFESLSKVSHPVGTTVRISNLFDGVPVRRQHATKEKECSKQLSKIKDMLKAYALARLHIRLNLKILSSTKKSNENGTWTFAPHISDTIKLAVSKIRRQESIGQKMPGFKIRPEMLPTSKRWRFEAVLLNTTVDITKAAAGQYISIDSRPVNATRGCLMKLVSSYRSLLERSSYQPSSLKSPFIRLNIVCEPGSYDLNVEPAKNEVIFADETDFLRAVQTFLEDVYLVPQLTPERQPNPHSSDTYSPNGLGEHEIMGSETEMSDRDGYQMSLNPWVIAKMRNPPSSSILRDVSSIRDVVPNFCTENQPDLLPTPEKTPRHSKAFTSNIRSDKLPSIQETSRHGHEKRTALTEWLNNVSSPPTSQLPNFQERVIESPSPITSGSLSIASINERIQYQSSDAHRFTVREVEEVPRARQNPNLYRPSHRSSTTPTTNLCKVYRLKQPARSELGDVELPGERNTVHEPARPQVSPPCSSAPSFFSFVSNLPADLDTAQIPVLSPPVQTATTPDRQPLQATLPDDDPRAYLMRRKFKATGHVGPRRTRTTMLPLETVPSKYALHNLLYTIHIDLDQINGKSTFYNTGGANTIPEEMTRLQDLCAEDRVAIRGQLDDVMRRWTVQFADQVVEVEYKSGIFELSKDTALGELP